MIEEWRWLAWGDDDRCTHDAITFGAACWRIISFRFMLPKPSEIFIGEKRAYASRRDVSRGGRVSPIRPAGREAGWKESYKFPAPLVFSFSISAGRSRVYSTSRKNERRPARTMRDPRSRAGQPEERLCRRIVADVYRELKGSRGIILASNDATRLWHLPFAICSIERNTIARSMGVDVRQRSAAECSWTKRRTRDAITLDHRPRRIRCLE